MEREGLLGAMPVGARWRSQGYIDGTTKYLGTYDSEDEAHRVFMAEKERVTAEKEAEAEVEVNRILSGPTFLYEGGKGRGASLNGTRFKIIAAHGPHQALVVPLRESGDPDFTEQTKVNTAYLTELPTEEAPAVEPTPVVAAPVPARQAALTVDSAVTVDDVLRFAMNTRKHDTLWALDFVGVHGTEEIAKAVPILQGAGGIEQALVWLRKNTTIPRSCILEAEKRITGSLFMSSEAQTAARVLHKGFPDSFDAPEEDIFLDDINDLV